MSVYRNERKNKRASTTALHYYLDKYRDAFFKYENDRRKELKEKENGRFI